MMNHFTNFGLLSSVWYYAHLLFCLLFLAGIVLLIIWMAKNLKKDDLRIAVIWFLVLGILGALITAPIGMRGFGSFTRGWNDYDYMMGGDSHDNQMSECMQDDDCHKKMEDFMHDMMGIEDTK